MSNKRREAAKRRGKKPRPAWLRWKETLLAETRTFEQKRTGGFTTIMNVGESWKMYITVSERKETCCATDATPLYRAYHGRQALHEKSVELDPLAT